MLYRVTEDAGVWSLRSRDVVVETTATGKYSAEDLQVWASRLNGICEQIMGLISPTEATYVRLILDGHTR